MMMTSLTDPKNVLFELVDEDLTSASVFHLPGKHDQKSHGGRRTSYPSGWQETSPIDLHVAWARAIQKRRLGRGDDSDFTKDEQRSMMDHVMNSPQAKIMPIYRGPNDSFIYMVNKVKVSKPDRDKLMNTVTDLSNRFPVKGGVRICVDRDVAFPWGVAGETVRGTGDMHLNGDAFKRSWATDKGSDWPSPVGREGPIPYVTSHEWGHTQDHLTENRRDDIYAKAMFAGGVGGTTMSAYAFMGGGVEALADAFADFNMTPPGAPYTYTSTKTWARELRWK